MSNLTVYFWYDDPKLNRNILKFSIGIGRRFLPWDSTINKRTLQGLGDVVSISVRSVTITAVKYSKRREFVKLNRNTIYK